MAMRVGGMGRRSKEERDEGAGDGEGKVKEVGDWATDGRVRERGPVQDERRE